MTQPKARIAILASGTGSNARIVIDHCRNGSLAADVVCVIADDPAAGALDHARATGVEAIAINAEQLGHDLFEQHVVDTLTALDVELVVLAGFMRICRATFLDAFAGRTINIHPSLLPAFPGRDGIGAALAAGVAQTGVTVHWVDAGIDTGPVIARQEVPIKTGDTRESLQRRIQAVEHELLPATIAALLPAILAVSQPATTAMPQPATLAVPQPAILAELTGAT